MDPCPSRATQRSAHFQDLLVVLPSSNHSRLFSGQFRFANHVMADQLQSSLLGRAADGVVQSSTAASDIFSLGVVLYELASGTNPFRAGSAAATTRLIQGLEVPPLPTQGEGVPCELDHLVRVMLHKSAADRPAASEVVLRLEALAQPRTPRRRNRSKLAHRQPSIAVLPFANMSSNKEQEHFSDGHAEEIINGLVRVPGLNVTARTSAFSFKGKDVKVAEIAHELGVEHILEGSVRKAGNRIRISAQLIKAADGFHLWSERFDRLRRRCDQAPAGPRWPG